MTEILKVMIGSQAHGLATPESDVDVRGVFVARTRDFFILGGDKEKVRSSSAVIGDMDSTSYEIGHFLSLATKSNPSVLEVFKAPVLTSTELGEELLTLFPYVWNSVDAFNAFRGYGLSQRKKGADNPDGKWHKYGVAWLRTLYNAKCLLQTGDFQMNVVGTEIEGIVRPWKSKKSWRDDSPLTWAEIENICVDYEGRLERAFEKYPRKFTDFSVVNDFILKVRKENW